MAAARAPVQPVTHSFLAASPIPVGNLSASVSSSRILTDKRRGSSAGSQPSLPPSQFISFYPVHKSVCEVFFFFSFWFGLVLSERISLIVTVNTLIRELNQGH